MRRLPWLSSKRRAREDADLRSVQERFGRFLSLLDSNNRVLKMLAELEAMAEGEHLYDLSTIRATFGL